MLVANVRKKLLKKNIQGKYHSISKQKHTM